MKSSILANPPPKVILADPTPGAVLLLARVPAADRSIVCCYLNSRQPADEPRGRELAARHDLAYDDIRRRWGVECPIEIEVHGELIRL